MNYPEVLAYLERNWIKTRFTRPVRDYPFDRLGALLAGFGQPQRRLEYVHVTGSKGKGSMARVCADVLRAHGLRVGLFTSPHLLRVEERVEVDGAPLSPERFADDFTHALEVQRETGQSALGISPLLLALALDRFARDGCEVAVVEVRAGGRYDPTNVVPARTFLLGPVELEHVPGLGHTLAEIAWQKIGLLKPGGVGFAARQRPRVRAVFEQESQAVGAALYWEGADLAGRVLTAAETGQTVCLRTPWSSFPPLRLALLGPHQAGNAALAVSAAERILRLRGRTLDPAALATALAAARWPARLERLAVDPPLLYDGAHTFESAVALRRALRAHYPGLRWTFVVGMIGGKRPEPFLRALRPVAARVLGVPIQGFAHLPPAQLAAAAAGLGLPAETCASPHQALSLARRRGTPCCVTGTLYLYREVMSDE